MRDRTGQRHNSNSAPASLPFGFAAWPVGTAAPVFDYAPLCPPHFGCVGHADNSALKSHHTHWERFGPSGIVATLDGHGPALVSLADLATDRSYTPEHALLVAHEISEASRFAQQYTLLSALCASAH